jgi:hypothetical protein
MPIFWRIKLVAASFFLCICIVSGCNTVSKADKGTPGTPLKTNVLPYYLVLEGTPYEQGLAHGRQLREQIHQEIGLWKDRLNRIYAVTPDSLINIFLSRTDYLSAIRKFTPDLLEEVKGIADGAEMDFNTILVFQYLDEVGMNSKDLLDDKCSALGVDRTADSPAIMAQNMDLEGFRNRYQTVLQIKKPDRDLEIMVFTCAGLIATNGLNNRGVGVCVNALTQLDYRLEGLPVAFVIRGLLDQPDQRKAVEFLKSVDHATGQNYMIGGPEKVLSFECSPGSVVEYLPEKHNGTISHTNHPFASEDFNPKYRQALAKGLTSETRDEDSEFRYQTLNRMIEESRGTIDVSRIQQILSSGHSQHPICRPYIDPYSSHTFGSTVMVLGENPELYVSPGPPDVNPYVKFGFAGGNPSKPISLRDIYAPVFVGTPPENAFHGLVQLPDGELRHYGFRGPQSNPTEHYYIFSLDNGLTWNEKGVKVTGSAKTEENGPPPARSPYSGDFLRLISGKDGTYVMRSKNGIDGEYHAVRINDERFEMIRQPLFLRIRQRILVTCGQSLVQGKDEIMQSCVFYSDDDGYHWQLARVPVGPRHEAVWPHRKTRWQNYAVEPTIAELADGRLWMLLRTSMDRLYESFSQDGGAAWSAPAPSRFYSTLTMPTFFRMKDSRLLLFWCNTTPLPEVDRSTDTTIREEQKNGLWEDVFTNRDAIHAAISEDDGKTWIGFRELYLNPLRNERDFAMRGGTAVSLDKSVHQSQAVELPQGKVLVALGQHPLVRAMVIFDPAWLYETGRSDSFANGLKDWSTFKYIDGIKGHCAYDRDPGAPLVEYPDKDKEEGRKALHIRRHNDQALVCENDGAVWNFPAGTKGTFCTSILLEPGGRGGRICLIDRWFNPIDTLAYRSAMYSLTFQGDGNIGDKPALQQGKWHELSFKWEDSRSGSCSLYIDGKPYPQPLELNVPSENGICYVHFQSIADREDQAGFLVESVKAKIWR